MLCLILCSFHFWWFFMKSTNNKFNLVYLHLVTLPVLFPKWRHTARSVFRPVSSWKRSDNTLSTSSSLRGSEPPSKDTSRLPSHAQRLSKPNWPPNMSTSIKSGWRKRSGECWGLWLIVDVTWDRSCGAMAMYHVWRKVFAEGRIVVYLECWVCFLQKF